MHEWNRNQGRRNRVKRGNVMYVHNNYVQCRDNVFGLLLFMETSGGLCSFFCEIFDLLRASVVCRKLHLCVVGSKI